MYSKNTKEQTQVRTLKNLINTPFKKVIFIIQIVSWFLIIGSPLIGALIGKALMLSTGIIAGIILGVFIAGEILFYVTLAFLGKEVLLLIKDKWKIWLTKFKKKSDSMNKNN